MLCEQKTTYKGFGGKKLPMFESFAEIGLVGKFAQRLSRDVVCRTLAVSDGNR